MVEGWRETVREKVSGAKMVRVWENRVLDHVRVRYVGESQSWVWYMQVIRFWFGVA